MPKKFLLVLLPFIFFATGCDTTNNEENPNDPDTNEVQEMPDDFDFSLIYGVYGKNAIDTFTDSVTKDLVIDGVAETELVLTEEDMEWIYEQMMESNIMGELDLDEDPTCITEPPSYTEWHIQMNGETKKIAYDDFCDEPADVLKLIELKDSIHELVSEKEVYQALPDSNGFYD